MLQGWGSIQGHGGAFDSCSYQDASHNHIGNGPDILVINQTNHQALLSEMYLPDSFTITNSCTQRRERISADISPHLPSLNVVPKEKESVLIFRGEYFQTSR
jgi:hypothetical protein